MLVDWLPASGLVLEIASGTGEHVTDFAARFPGLEWQPTDLHPDALASITAWSERAGQTNVRPPVQLDAALPNWPIANADAILCINMVHISPWDSALGLLDGHARHCLMGGHGGPEDPDDQVDELMGAVGRMLSR